MPDYSRLHKWHHDDYKIAVEQIHAHIGDMTDIHVFGRQVLVAVYVRPNINPVTGMIQTTKSQMEDVWQGKAVLVLKLGPEAFQGEGSYAKAMFGDMDAPKPGEWLFLASNSGMPIQLCGDGGHKVMVKDHHDEDMPVFDWDGWPCRIIPDDQFVGRLANPHSVV